MNKFYLVITFLVLCSSCTSTKEIMNSWLGATKQQLIQKWGPPNRVTSDGGNGEILIYAKQGYYPGINGQGAFAYWDYSYMYADVNGKIYYWKTNTERIPPSQINLNIYRRY
jgi:hypothetical protein